LAHWDRLDAEDCPFSGSLLVPDVQSTENGVAQCAPVAGNMPYVFGGWFKGTKTVLDCRLLFKNGVDCTGAGVGDLALPDTSVSAVDWTEISASGIASTEARSALVVCYAFGLSIDKLYLSPAPLMF
jgi:hypothetical protein